MFEDISFDSRLSAEQQLRYRRASHYAERYCQGLEHAYLRARGRSGLLRELRRFYRLTQHQKIARIESRPH